MKSMSPKNSILLSSLLFTAATVASSNATTLGFGAGTGSRTVFEEDLFTQVAVGSLVWTGTFANESFSLGVGTVADNVTAIQLAGGWSQFTGSSTLGIANVLGNNKVGGLVTDNSVTANSFNGDNVYLWVFNASSVGTATEMGIFRATSVTGTSPAWVFPTNAGGVGDSVTLSTVGTGLNTSTIAAVGGVGSATSGTLALEAPTPVPEPSTFTAGAMLAMVAMGVRRRRRG